MNKLKEFSENIVPLAKTHFDRAIAFLWFYRANDLHDDRTADELAKDLHEQDFPKPRISRLRQQLTVSRMTTNGSRAKSYKLSLSALPALDKKYGSLLKQKRIVSSSSIVPFEWGNETRSYIVDLIKQINGSFDMGFYDACAVLMRRLMETLLIEIYVSKKKADDVKEDGNFIPLEKLINKANSNKDFHFNRNARKEMIEIKELGDRAAHDRVYITHERDIDGLVLKYRRTIKELMVLSGLSN